MIYTFHSSDYGKLWSAVQPIPTKWTITRLKSLNIKKGTPIYDAGNTGCSYNKTCWILLWIIKGNDHSGRDCMYIYLYKSAPFTTRVTRQVAQSSRNCQPFRSTWVHSPVFNWVRVTRSLVSVWCFVDHCFFLLTIVLSVLRFIASDHPFGILKLFLCLVSGHGEVCLKHWGRCYDLFH